MKKDIISIDLLKHCKQNMYYNIYNYLIDKYYEQIQLLINNKEKEENVVIIKFLQSEIERIKKEVE